MEHLTKTGGAESGIQLTSEQIPQHTHNLGPTCVHSAQFQSEPDYTCLCGGQIEIFGHTGAFIAGCKKCKKHSPWLDSVQQAKAWIRKYGKEARVEVIGECYGAVPPNQKEGEHI